MIHILVSSLLLTPFFSYASDDVIELNEETENYVFVCHSDEDTPALALHIPWRSFQTNDCNPIMNKWSSIIKIGYEEGRLNMSGHQRCAKWPSNVEFLSTYVFRPRTKNDFEYFEKYVTELENTDFFGEKLKFHKILGCNEEFFLDAYFVDVDANKTRIISSDKKTIFHSSFKEYNSVLQKFERAMRDGSSDQLLGAIEFRFGDDVSRNYKTYVLPKSNALTSLSKFSYSLDNGLTALSGWGSYKTRNCGISCSE